MKIIIKNAGFTISENLGNRSRSGCGAGCFFLLRGIDDRGAIPAKIQVKVSADDPSRSSYDLLEQLYVSRWEFGTNVNGFGCGFVGPEKN